MIHDRGLLERLSVLPVEAYEGNAFRATRAGLDPLAFSCRGGRWARREGTAVLYTSLDRSGALAELCYHWTQITPYPTKPAILHDLRISTQRTLRIIRTKLSELGINHGWTTSTDYHQTQLVGEAVAFLECDGLIVPSARWDCDNLVLFNDNCADSSIEIIDREEIDWLDWAQKNGLAD